MEGHTAFAVLHCWCLGTPAPSPIGSATTLASVAAESSLLLELSTSLQGEEEPSGEAMGANCLAQTNALFRKNLVIQVMRPHLLITQISLRVSGSRLLFRRKNFSLKFASEKDSYYCMLDPVNSEELKNAALVFWSQDSIFFLPERIL